MTDDKKNSPMEPKDPPVGLKPEPKSTSKSGEYLLELATKVESPIAYPPPPAPLSMPSPLPPPPSQPEIKSVAVIDPEKLLLAWNAGTEVQRELISVIKKNEEDNQVTQRDNRRTRLIVLGALVLNVLVVAFAAITSAKTLEKMRLAMVQVTESVDHSNEDTQATLTAVRAVAKAVGAKIEADTTTSPGSEQKALKAGVEAQTAALEAETKVSPSPEVKAKASEELKQIKERARVLRIDTTPPNNNVDASADQDADADARAKKK